MGMETNLLELLPPLLRALAKQYQDMPLAQVKQMLNSKIHEERAAAVYILNLKFENADEAEKSKLYQFYMEHRKRFNNWDLVDMSAPYVAGPYLFNRNKKILYQLARSKSLWDRRISILTTFYFIRQNRFGDTMRLSRLLLKDKEDLMHKAVGWMLREVGNRNKRAETCFLKAHAPHMPRTMLRYAIERFPERERQRYLKS